MKYDFDPEIQEVFSTRFERIPLTNWKSWLAISSAEEYESAAIAQSGLSGLGDLFERIQVEKTDPQSFSVDPESCHDSSSEPLILCHTSGTSGGSISDVKWFCMTEELVNMLWAPGMQAIFESSGLDTRSSAVIFVPSRAKPDGLSSVEQKPVVKLYSAEFSQRLVLSLVRPRSYLLYEYKDASNLRVLAQMLSMDRISVVSAPFATVLRWANLKRLRQSLEKSLNSDSHDKDTPEAALKKEISQKGVRNAATEIQEQLSELLSGATLIFSATAMTAQEWKTIQNFLRWKEGEERVTNLYVGSEVGPFAASIGPHSWRYMDVFPLTVPVLACGKERHILSKSPFRTGTLFVSRMHDSNPLINIDTGDVITVRDREGLPVIEGEILRAQFPLKTEITLSPAMRVLEPSTIFVGSYFDLDGIEVKNPRLLVTCLAEQCHVDRISSLVLKKDVIWVLVVPLQDEGCSPTVIRESLSSCPSGAMLEKALRKDSLKLELVTENPVKSVIPRSELLKKVRNGELPKGVLMKWPLYVVVPSREADTGY